LAYSFSTHRASFVPLLCFLLIGGLIVPTSVRAHEAAPNGGALPQWTPLRLPEMDPFARMLLVMTAGGLATAWTLRADNAELAASRLDGSPLEGWFDFGNVYGHGLTLGGGMLGLYLAGTMFDNPRLAAASMDLTRSLLSGGALVWGLKAGVNRPRPNGGKHSFPSGHAAAAFSVAPVLMHHFGWQVGVPAYILATGTAAGRMEERRHYLSDVIFGATIGIAAGYWAISDHKPLGFLDKLVIDHRQVGATIRF
jgi:membrane-associated phospholipid phosphatase